MGSGFEFPKCVRGIPMIYTIPSFFFLKYQIILLRNQNWKERVVNRVLEADPPKILALVVCSLKTNANVYWNGLHSWIFFLYYCTGEMKKSGIYVKSRQGCLRLSGYWEPNWGLPLNLSAPYWPGWILSVKSLDCPRKCFFCSYFLKSPYLKI